MNTNYANDAKNTYDAFGIVFILKTGPIRAVRAIGFFFSMLVKLQIPTHEFLKIQVPQEYKIKLANNYIIVFVNQPFLAARCRSLLLRREKTTASDSFKSPACSP